MVLKLLLVRRASPHINRPVGIRIAVRQVQMSLVGRSDSKATTIHASNLPVAHQHGVSLELADDRFDSLIYSRGLDKIVDSIGNLLLSDRVPGETVAYNVLVF